MNKLVSPYYPPRARWYSPVSNAAAIVRRRLCLDRIHLPDGISLGAFVVGLLAPGLAFYVRGEILIGRAVLIGCAFLAIFFLIWLGYPLANVTFGLILSAHVSSILFLCRPWLIETRFRVQIAFGLAVLALVGGGVYTPMRNLIQERYLMPLRVHGHVVVVQTFSSPQSVKRGDWIAYSLPNVGLTGIRLVEGLGLRPVLAVAGDRVQFKPGAIEVNGVSQELLPQMPSAGELIVQEKQWFIWPELDISGRGDAASAMFHLATVPETQFIGKPFKRWFWRRQVLL